MYQLVFVAFGAMALVLSIFALAGRIDLETEVVLSYMSFVFWGVWALSAGSVRVVDGGAEVVNAYPSLIIVGGLFAIMMFVSATYKMIGLIEMAKG